MRKVILSSHCVWWVSVTKIRVKNKMRQVTLSYLTTHGSENKKKQSNWSNLILYKHNDTE